MRHWGILLFFLYCFQAQAQNITLRHQVWLGAFAQFKLSPKWSVWLDGQYRTFEHFHYGISAIAGRTGIIYKVTPTIRSVAGYAYFRSIPLSGNLPAPHEHRGWQMLQHTWNLPKVRLINGIRAEQRFRERVIQGKHTGEYAYNHRFRYNINAIFKLNKTKGVVIGNEIMMNIGKEIIYNQFDQNRVWIGLQHQISPVFQVQVLYMLLYQHLPRPNERLLSHNIRITLLYI